MTSISAEIIRIYALALNAPSSAEATLKDVEAKNRNLAVIFEQEFNK